MRHIQKKNEPQSLTEWRAAHRNDPNFGYLLIEASLRREIRQALVDEQGGLCAYTGRRIDEASCHIEHPKPQAHCTNGEDVSFANMLACVPAPNVPSLPYGAHKKGSWPDATEEAPFVSPLRPGCEERFSFTLNGEIRASNPTDAAAKKTIDQLGLNHALMKQLRKAAIDATLGIQGRGHASLDLHRARARLHGLRTAEQNHSPLEPFCFVLKQALQRHITRVEAIRKSKRELR
jgi:uncharacterized protein (TIGR02646 family)